MAFVQTPVRSGRKIQTSSVALSGFVAYAVFALAVGFAAAMVLGLVP
jgi:hypothetical protein